jgi:hypothetical protein
MPHLPEMKINASTDDLWRYCNELLRRINLLADEY